MSKWFSVLPGLSGEGPLPERFSHTGRGKFSEGFVVQFHPESSSPWVGNFQRGVTAFDRVTDHPDRAHVIVIAGGLAYIVNPESRQLLESFGASIENTFELPASNQLLLGNGLWFESFGVTGRQWRSKQISSDGMRSVRLEGTTLSGEAWDAPSQRWVLFALDTQSGKFSGGATALGDL